jgi:hypothetical protein
MDGVDLWLDQASQGEVVFDSKVGHFAVDLSRLDDQGGRVTFDAGGLGMEVRVERYPEDLTEYRLELACQVEPEAEALSPYWVKGVQSDGHMVWSSPVYVQPRSS